MLRERLVATWWGRAVFCGVPFGVVFGLLAGSHDHGWVSHAITGVFGGVVFGLGMSVSIGRIHKARQERIRGLTSGLSQAERRLAQRATLRGPIPQDLRLRSASAGLARYQLEEFAKVGDKSILLFGGFGVVGVWLALTTSHWYWAEVAVFAFFLVLSWWQPRRLRQRLQRLEA